MEVFLECLHTRNIPSLHSYYEYIQCRSMYLVTGCCDFFSSGMFRALKLPHQHKMRWLEIVIEPETSISITPGLCVWGIDLHFQIIFGLLVWIPITIKMDFYLYERGLGILVGYMDDTLINIFFQADKAHKCISCFQIFFYFSGNLKYKVLICLFVTYWVFFTTL